MTNSDTESPAEALKAFFRNHASGVAIITGRSGDDSPIGFTATSLTSLGTNPPLVSFNVAQGASFYPHLVEGAFVNLHALAVENLELAIALAGPREERFQSANWHRDSNQVPVFHGATAVLHCKILKVVEVESNAVVIVQALDGFAGDGSTPLLYHQRAFIAGGKILKSNAK